MLLVRSTCILSNTTKHCNQVSHFATKVQAEKSWSLFTNSKNFWSEKDKTNANKNKQSFHFNTKYFTAIPIVVAGSTLEYFFDEDDNDEDDDPGQKRNPPFTKQHSAALKWMHTFHEKPDLTDVPKRIVSLIGPDASVYWAHRSSLTDLEEYVVREECYEEAKIRSIYPAVGFLTYLLKKYPNKADEWVKEIAATASPLYRTYIVLALDRADYTKIPFSIDHSTRLRVEQMKRASSARVATSIGEYCGSGNPQYPKSALQYCEKAAEDDATFWSTLTFYSFIDCAAQPRGKDQLNILKNSTKNIRVKRILQKVVDEAKPLDFY